MKDVTLTAIEKRWVDAVPQVDAMVVEKPHMDARAVEKPCVGHPSSLQKPVGDGVVIMTHETPLS